MYCVKKFQLNSSIVLYAEKHSVVIAKYDLNSVTSSLCVQRMRGTEMKGKMKLSDKKIFAIESHDLDGRFLDGLKSREISRKI